MYFLRINSKNSISTFIFCQKRNCSQTTANYCLETVKKYDYENFVCTLLLKEHCRSAAFAVRSFNVEVGRVAENVSQPNIGIMRLKFWEDTIAKCFLNDLSKVPQHPVAIELFKAINNSKLTKRFLLNLISSRANNLNQKSFKTVEELEKYSELSVSNVYYLLLEGAGIKNVNADHAASHLGKAQGIVQHLRTVPIAKKINFIAIPQDILNKYKIGQEDVIRGKQSENLNECAFEVASRAHQHLIKCKNLSKEIPKEGKSVLLPFVVVENYLNRLQKVNHNILHPSLKNHGWFWLPRLWYKSVLNQY